MIKEVKSIEDADTCDVLLTELIQEERKYNNSIDKNYVVKNHFTQMLNDKNIKILAYYLDNTIVGYILIRKINNYTCLLDGLYVLKEYRNKKIGTKLLKEALKKCKDFNVKYVDISVMEENKIAKSMYKKMKFTEYEIKLRKEI